MLRQDTSKPKRQIALNIQTTGYEASKGDMITEIAAIEYIDGQITENEFVTLVNPEGRKIDPGAVKCNKITNKMLGGEPTFDEIADDLLDFIKNDQLIVHNAVYVSTFIDSLMNRRIERAQDHKVTLEAALEKLEETIDSLKLEYNELVDLHKANCQNLTLKRCVYLDLTKLKTTLLEEKNNTVDKEQKAACKAKINTCIEQIIRCEDQIAVIENVLSSQSHELKKLGEKINTFEAELEDCKEELNTCERIANTEWTTICADRDVLDVMEMHQLLYPRREGYSHKLNDICAQFDIDATVEHTAANRAVLAMEAFQELYHDYAEKKKQLAVANTLQNDRNRLFSPKRNASVMNNADADHTHLKKAANR